MPYKSVKDLPAQIRNKYGPSGEQAFLAAFNNALKEYKGDEAQAFAVAHTAAKRADKTAKKG